MARAVHGQAERGDVLPPSLNQRLVGVVDGILLFYSLPAVASVLRTPITDEEQDLGLGSDSVQQGRGVPDGRTHTRRVEGRNPVDATPHQVRKRLLQVLDDVELNVLPAVP